jgi:hypothetical protein
MRIHQPKYPSFTTKDLAMNSKEMNEQQLRDRIADLLHAMGEESLDSATHQEYFDECERHKLELMDRRDKQTDLVNITTLFELDSYNRAYKIKH